MDLEQSKELHRIMLLFEKAEALVEKTRRVIYSCHTEDQYTGAYNYAMRAIAFLDKLENPEMAPQIIDSLNYKANQLRS